MVTQPGLDCRHRDRNGGIRAANRAKCASLTVLLAAALLSSCAGPDRGRCLDSHIERHYHPTDVFIGGFAGYTHEYIPSDDPVCDRWEYPNGRPGS
jgi:hypothetical protein